MNIILLGPPGAGKGTQAAGIVNNFGMPHISTGDIFRKNIKEGTELGKKAQEYMNKGELVPDALVIEIALDRLKEDDCAEGFLLDGFPRTVEQAAALDEYLEGIGKKVDFVLDITVPREELVSRLTARRVCKACGASFNVITVPPKQEGICDNCGAELIQRDDDTAETANNRIDVYNKETKPLIDYYEKAGNIKHINGAQPVDALAAEIAAILGA